MAFSECFHLILNRYNLFFVFTRLLQMFVTSFFFTGIEVPLDYGKAGALLYSCCEAVEHTALSYSNAGRYMPFQICKRNTGTFLK